VQTLNSDDLCLQAAEDSARSAHSKVSGLLQAFECQKMYTADVEAQAVHVLMRRDELMRAYAPLTKRMKAAEDDARQSRARIKEVEAEMDAYTAVNYAGLAQELGEKCVAFELQIEDLEKANQGLRESEQANQLVRFSAGLRDPVYGRLSLPVQGNGDVQASACLSEDIVS
jgi:hypothetical protein